MEPIKILIIHDTMTILDPLVFTLQESYGKENVILENLSNKGIEYINNNITSKLIVLLDFDLGMGQPNAPVVFKKIREKTSLVYVIIYTAKLLTEIPQEDLKFFINNDALALLQSTADMEEVLAVVDSAKYQLDTRVDCILEQWISKRSQEDLEKPYLTSKSGKIYTLQDLMIEIRKQTELGQKMEKSILQLAIDLLTSNERQLDD